MPDEMDVHRLIAEVKKRPTLWDVRFSEYKDRTNTPQMWQEISEILGFDVEHCKRKWKNLRDAFRAEVRRTERRLERMKANGQYDKNTNLTSKWVYFEPMNFINETKRRIKYGTPTGALSAGNSPSQEENPENYDPAFHSFCDIKMEPHATTDEDEEEADDILFEEFKNVATPQAARRVSESCRANTLAATGAATAAAPSSAVAPAEETAAMNISETAAPSCSCTKRADDQVHFLENLEREEQKLMQSTRQDMTRANTLGHVGDADYNFLVSFLPQMKKMTELQNLQFRAKMSELLLNIMTPPTLPQAILGQALVGFNPANMVNMLPTAAAQMQVMSLPQSTPLSPLPPLPPLQLQEQGNQQQQAERMDTEPSGSSAAVASSTSNWT